MLAVMGRARCQRSLGRKSEEARKQRGAELEKTMEKALKKVREVQVAAKKCDRQRVIALRQKFDLCLQAARREKGKAELQQLRDAARHSEAVPIVRATSPSSEDLWPVRRQGLSQKRVTAERWFALFRWARVGKQ